MKTGRRMNGSKRLFPAILCAVLFIAAAGHADLFMELTDLGHGAYHVEGWFSVQAPVQTAWQVLTDYEHITSFVSTLNKSRVVESRPGVVLVEQEGVGRLFFFSREVGVLLRVIEKPYTRIEFEDISHKDFVSYKGFWEFRQKADGLDVLYTLDCHRRFKVPNFMARDAMKKSAQQQLADVRSEILRRTQEALHELKD